jgi:hypothetical protein
MSDRAGKILLAGVVLLFLLPLTAWTVLIVALSYPAYPIPDPGALQIVFDIAMLLQIVGIAAAWRLAARYFRAGREGLARLSRAWLLLLGVGALVGGIGAGFAAEHALDPRSAEDYVGFALLCPAVLLVPIWWFMWRNRRHAAAFRTDGRTAIRRTAS